MPCSSIRFLSLHLAGVFVVGVLCGCGESAESVEFSSEVTEEELKLGELLMEGPEDPLAVEGEDVAGASMADAEKTTADLGSIHFFSPGLARPFAAVQLRLFEAFIQEAEGPSVRVHDARDDARLQEAGLTAAIKAEVKGIVLCPVDSASLRDEVAKALEAGIPVVVIGAGREELPGSVNLPVDYYKVGQMAGEFVVQRLKIKSQMERIPEVTGEIVEITGTEELETDFCRKMSEGFMSVIGRYPGVRLVHRAPGFWHGRGGAERVLEATRSQPGANVVFCHNDAMAIGAYYALREEEREDGYLIVGVDGIGGPDGGIARVREQMLGGTIAVPPLSRSAANVMLALVEGEPVPEVEETLPELVTIANSFKMYRRHMYRPFGEADPE